MKIYIALFATLIAAGHFTSVSAADATASVDGASHPHLRALADAAVGVACPNGSCKYDSQCDEGSVCEGGSGGGGCTGTCGAGAVTKPPVVSPCPEWECNSNGDGCPSGTTCNTSYSGSIDGCFGCHTGTAATSNGGIPAPPLGLKLAASTTVDMIEEVEEEEEVDAIQDHEDDVEASSLRASILKEE